MHVHNATRGRRTVASAIQACGLAVALLLVLLVPVAEATVPSSSAVSAWGRNVEGQLGDGTSTDRSRAGTLPDLVDAVGVAAGAWHSLAVDGSGSVWTWGRDPLGTASGPARVDGVSGVVAVAAGNHHSLAVDDEGTVWAWGRNTLGQLGDGTLEDRAVPTAVPGLTGVVAIAGGAGHSLALDDQGRVWAWGSNDSGQLGDGTSTPRSLPVPVANLEGVTAIAAGALHSMALLHDGTARAWGDDWHGQLGTSPGDSGPTPAPVQDLHGIVAIAAGNAHSLALLDRGIVRAWGDNRHGQLGDGTTMNRRPGNGVSWVYGVTRIAAGGNHSLAVLDDGTMRAWGANASGQLGDLTTQDRVRPLHVWGLAGVTAIAAGNAHSVALRSAPVQSMPPTQLTATVGDATALLSWVPTPDGGSPVTGHEVEVYPSQTLTVAADVSSVQVDGLQNGKSHLFRVRTINEDAGPGPWSYWSEYFVPFSVPDAPSDVIVTHGCAWGDCAPPWSPTGPTVRVSWTAPAHDGGRPITGYRITRQPGNVALDVGAVTSSLIPGLTYGESYTFTVAAINVAGVGPASAASPEVTPRSAPAAPTTATATAGDHSATVSWVTSPDGGSPITAYDVLVTPGGRVEQVPGTVTSTTITDLANGTDHAFQVRAVTEVGSGPWSGLSNWVTPTGVVIPPVTPTGVTATVGFDSLAATSPKPRVALAWSTEGSPDAIMVSWSNGSTSRSVTLSPPPSSYTVRGLTPGTAYTFEVRAVSGGMQSSPASVKTSGSVLTAAARPTVVVSGKTTTVSGRLTRAGSTTRLADRPVQLQVRTQDATGAWSGWSKVGSAVRTTSTGTYAITHRTPRNARYRVVFGGSGIQLGTVSPVRAVSVAPAVTAKLSTTSVQLGSGARLTGTAAPNLAGTTVHLQKYVDGRWVSTGRSQALGSTSAYRFVIRPGSRGTHTYRVLVPPAKPYVRGTSPSRALKVT